MSINYQDIGNTRLEDNSSNDIFTVKSKLRPPGSMVIEKDIDFRGTVTGLPTSGGSPRIIISGGNATDDFSFIKVRGGNATDDFSDCVFNGGGA